MVTLGPGPWPIQRLSIRLSTELSKGYPRAHDPRCHLCFGWAGGSGRHALGRAEDLTPPLPLPWETHPCLFSIFVLMCCLVLPDFVSEYQGIPRGGSRNAQESKMSQGNVKCLKGKPRERRGTPRETPKAAKGRPQGRQGAVKGTSRGTKVRAKGARRRPREAKGRPRDAKEGPRGGREDVKGGQGEAMGRPGSSKGRPRGRQGRPKRGQGRPRGAQGEAMPG